MRTFLLLIFLATRAALAAPLEASCRAAAVQQQPAPDGWLLLAALVVCAAGRWSR